MKKLTKIILAQNKLIRSLKFRLRIAEQKAEVYANTHIDPTVTFCGEGEQ